MAIRHHLIATLCLIGVGLGSANAAWAQQPAQAPERTDRAMGRSGDGPRHDGSPSLREHRARGESDPFPQQLQSALRAYVKEQMAAGVAPREIRANIWQALPEKFQRIVKDRIAKDERKDAAERAGNGVERKESKRDPVPAKRGAGRGDGDQRDARRELAPRGGRSEGQREKTPHRRAGGHELGEQNAKRSAVQGPRDGQPPHERLRRGEGRVTRSGHDRGPTMGQHSGPRAVPPGEPQAGSQNPSAQLGRHHAEDRRNHGRAGQELGKQPKDRTRRDQRNDWNADRRPSEGATRNAGRGVPPPAPAD